LGELALGAGDYENAAREFREETRLAPGSAVAAYKLGVVSLSRGQTREAIAELKRADSLQLDMPETLLELGKAMAAAGEPAQAEKPLRKVLELEPASALAETAHYQLAQIYRRMGRTEEADREMKLFQEIRKSRK